MPPPQMVDSAGPLSTVGCHWKRRGLQPYSSSSVSAKAAYATADSSFTGTRKRSRLVPQAEVDLAAVVADARDLPQRVGPDQVDSRSDIKSRRRGGLGGWFPGWQFLSWRHGFYRCSEIAERSSSHLTSDPSWRRRRVWRCSKVTSVSLTSCSSIALTMFSSRWSMPWRKLSVVADISIVPSAANLTANLIHLKVYCAVSIQRNARNASTASSHFPTVRGKPRLSMMT